MGSRLEWEESTFNIIHVAVGEPPVLTRDISLLPHGSPHDRYAYSMTAETDREGVPEGSHSLFET